MDLDRPSPPAARHSTLDALASGSFCRVADARPFSGNQVRLLQDGAANYPVWLDAIAAAERSVELENYLIKADAVGQSFADALAAAARRGVRCKVLYDWLGCRSKTPGRFWRALRGAGVEVRCYNPPQLGNPLQWVSRDHRKVLCIDGRIGFTGGLCIGQDWLGDPARNIPGWRDTALELRGPAVAYLSQAFADSWRSAGAVVPPGEPPLADPEPYAGGIAVWIIAGQPDSMGLYRLEQLVAEIVERSLWLTDAYFVATTGYVRALTAAAQAGVDVRILVPNASNLKLVRAISRAAYRPLLEAGVRVFEWNGPMMHAKSAVADGCWSRVGSSNSNLASWISNRELDVTIHDENLASEMEAQYLRDLDNATEVLLKSESKTQDDVAGRPRYRGRPVGSASRLLATAVGLGSAVGATLARHRVIGASESRFIAAAGALLMLFGVTTLLLPRLIAYPIAAVATWVGVSLLLRARGLRRSAAPDRTESP